MNRNTAQHREIRVLLVDDETDFTSVLSKRMSRQGLAVSTASDGSEAHGLLESRPFDVVVLDVDMPGVNGVHVLKSIKEQYPEVEVIMLTGRASIPEALKCRSAGAFDFLFKPTETSDLIEVIVAAAGSRIPRTDGNRPATMAV